MLDLNNLSKIEYKTLLKYSNGDGCRCVVCGDCAFYRKGLCVLNSSIEIIGYAAQEYFIKLRSQELLTEYLKRIIESE